MRKHRLRFALFVALMTPVFSCGIPTSMPILPKAVTVKAAPAVSVPLGEVNYNLYSGLNGKDMSGGKGSLEELLGPSWLQDLKDQGATLYDYRPAGVEDDGTQKFLVHYRLDMEGDMGASSEFDLREYQEMLDELTGKPTKIDDVSFKIPPVTMEEEFEVDIPLDKIANGITEKLRSMSIDTAYLPVKDGISYFDFPDGVSKLAENSGSKFSIALEGFSALTFQDATLIFDFTLRYGPLAPPPAGSTLTLSGFELRDAEGKPIPKVSPSTEDGSGSVSLKSDNDTGRLFMKFDKAELPNTFYLACNLEIKGTGKGLFELDIHAGFEEYMIFGAKDLVLSQEQIDSLYAPFPPLTCDTGDSVGPSFKAIIETGSLEIDTRNLFPPIDPEKPNDEGWDFTLDLSEIVVKQEDADPGDPNLAPIKGLSLGGTGLPIKAGLDNDILVGESLNYHNVDISGTVRAIPSRENLKGEKVVTFQNFSSGNGISKNGGNEYKKWVAVRMNVTLFSEVTVLAEDFGLDAVDQDIEQDLGEDFRAFKPWLNYIQFPERTDEDPPDYGLGVALEIETLHIVGGLGLFINAPEFGLNNIFQPLENLKDQAPGQAKARLIFLNKDSGGYKLRGDDLPEKEPVLITVKLGLEDPTAQEIYKKTGILTMTDVVPGDTITLNEINARMLFDWTVMSIKPLEHTNEGDDDPLPTYPFTGTFPDPEKDEKGIDLSSIPKGLGFYIPEENGGEAGEELEARLYISLKRQKLDDTGVWKDDSGGWDDNLQVNLPNLDFRVRYSDNSKSDNLFTPAPNTQPGTGAWTLSRTIGEILEEDTENENEKNPFRIYAASLLPEADKAIPVGNLAKELNQVLSGTKEGPLFFEYAVELADVSGEKANKDSGEILLYPDMLKKRVLVSADFLALVPLVFQALPGADPDSPIVMTMDPDLGNTDLFQRKDPDDNQYFDLVTAFEFNIAVKNVAGLSAGKVFLENKTDSAQMQYRLPLIDFANPRNSLSLDSAGLEKLKTIWPFVPRLSIEFKSGDRVRIERDFNIELQSVTVKLGGEYTVETGL